MLKPSLLLQLGNTLGLGSVQRHENLRFDRIPNGGLTFSKMVVQTILRFLRSERQ